jgi:chromosome partitioning protein
MAVLGVVSQKGGVGKSTLARAIATSFAGAKWRVKIADLDLGQKTVSNWQALRLEGGYAPQISVEAFGAVADVLKIVPQFELVVIDGRPAASKQTEEVAKASDMLVLPTGTSLDDLIPSLSLARELVSKGIQRKRIVFLFNCVKSTAAIADALGYLEPSGFTVIPDGIPERQAYENALNAGHSITETPYPALNAKAEVAVDHIAKIFTELMK